MLGYQAQRVMAALQGPVSGAWPQKASEVTPCKAKGRQILLLHTLVVRLVLDNVDNILCATYLIGGDPVSRLGQGRQAETTRPLTKTALHDT